jgi:hypothetical protein
LIATGNSTSIRTSAAYTPSLGPSFQSSHTHMICTVSVFMILVSLNNFAVLNCHAAVTAAWR